MGRRMTFSAQSTKQGLFCFEVELQDGRVFSESDFLWDEVPKDSPVVRLSMKQYTGPGDRVGTELFELSGFARYGFSNEAVWAMPQEKTGFKNRQALTAKIFIGVQADRTAILTKIILEDGVPRVKSGATTVASMAFEESVYRDGAG